MESGTPHSSHKSLGHLSSAWGVFLISKVYSPCPLTLETQRQRIEEEVDRIPHHGLKPSQTQPSCILKRMLAILRSRRSIIASLLFTQQLLVMDKKMRDHRQLNFLANSDVQQNNVNCVHITYELL